MSTSGGLPNGIERAQNIGAEAIQIFGAAPQSWRRRVYTPEEGQAFKEAAQAADVRPVFIHGVYLVNLATGPRAPGQVRRAPSVGRHDALLLIGMQGRHLPPRQPQGAGFDAVFAPDCRLAAGVLDTTPDERG